MNPIRITTITHPRYPDVYRIVKRLLQETPTKEVSRFVDIWNMIHKAEVDE